MSRRGGKGPGGRATGARPAQGPGASEGAAGGSGASDASTTAGVWIVTVDETEARLEYEEPGQPRRDCGRGETVLFGELRAFVCEASQPGDLVVIGGRVFFRPVAPEQQRPS